MRPTVFAELAAAELRSGTECCGVCDFVYYIAVDKCPRCAQPHPFYVEPRRDAGQALGGAGFRGQPVADLGGLTLRDLGGADLPRREGSYAVY